MALQPPPLLQQPPQAPPAVQTQSWAAWLLDAYASTATSPIMAEYPHDDDEGGEEYHYQGDYLSEKKSSRMAGSQQQQQQQLQPQQQPQRRYEDSEPSSASSTLSPASASASSARSYSSGAFGAAGNGNAASAGVAEAGRSVSAHTPSSAGYGQGYGQGYGYPAQQPLYARTGRGGAGNYVWGSLGAGRASLLALPSERDRDGGGGGLSLSERRAAAKRLQRIETVSAAGKEGGRVMSVGRGGAGNYAAKSPVAFVAATTTTNEGVALRSVSAPTPTSSGVVGGGYGRGGAGNVGRAEEDKERKRKEVREQEMLEAERRREMIEALVDDWLMPPPTAMVGVGRRGSWIG